MKILSKIGGFIRSIPFSKGFEFLMGLPIKKIAIGLVITWIFFMAYVLVVKPRIDLANERAAVAEKESAKQELINNALIVIQDANASVEAERIISKNNLNTKKETRQIKSDKLEVVIQERIAVDGDPFVSEGMQEFLEELAK